MPQGLMKMINDKNDGYFTHGALKKACGYILQVKHPLKALLNISKLLATRELDIMFLQMQTYDNSGDIGVMILHCRLEKDRIKFVASLLKKVPGVEKVEWMEDTKRDTLF